MPRNATIPLPARSSGSKVIRWRGRLRGVGLGLGVSLMVAVSSVAADPSVRPAVAQIANRPNILLVVTDDQRADMLRAMPTLMNRIGGEGIRFRRGFVPNALCCPSRASILTGNYSHTTGVWGNSLATGYGAFDESSTLATSLDDAGYRTGLFGKYLNHWRDTDPTHVPPGWDGWFAFFENCCSYYGFTASVNGTPTDFGDDVYATTESARRAARFIVADEQQPFFVLWAPDAPHQPARAETRYAGTFSDLEPWRPPNYMEKDVSDKPAWVRSSPVWSHAQRAAADRLRRRMFETLISVDDGLQMLLDALATSGRLSNTLIVFTSDNGFLLGEHRFRGKPYPWDASHRVPFVIRYDPLVTSPTTSTALVLTIDIAPTILDVAGVAAPPMDGRSLVPILSQERVGVRSRFVIEHAYNGGPAPPYCGTRSRSSLFVRYATGEEEFYDYRQDPWELRNRTTDLDFRTRITLARRFTREHCSPTPPGFSW